MCLSEAAGRNIHWRADAVMQMQSISMPMVPRVTTSKVVTSTGAMNKLVGLSVICPLWFVLCFSTTTTGVRMWHAPEAPPRLGATHAQPGGGVVLNAPVDDDAELDRWNEERGHVIQPIQVVMQLASTSAQLHQKQEEAKALRAQLDHHTISKRECERRMASLETEIEEMKNAKSQAKEHSKLRHAERERTFKIALDNQEREASEKLSQAELEKKRLFEEKLNLERQYRTKTAELQKQMQEQQRATLKEGKDLLKGLQGQVGSQAKKIALLENRTKEAEKQRKEAQQSCKLQTKNTEKLCEELKDIVTRARAQMVGNAKQQQGSPTGAGKKKQRGAGSFAGPCQEELEALITGVLSQVEGALAKRQRVPASSASSFEAVPEADHAANETPCRNTSSPPSLLLKSGLKRTVSYGGSSASSEQRPLSDTTAVEAELQLCEDLQNLDLQDLADQAMRKFEQVDLSLVEGLASAMLATAAETAEDGEDPPSLCASPVDSISPKDDILPPSAIAGKILRSKAASASCDVDHERDRDSTISGGSSRSTRPGSCTPLSSCSVGLSSPGGGGGPRDNKSECTTPSPASGSCKTKTPGRSSPNAMAGTRKGDQKSSSNTTAKNRFVRQKTPTDEGSLHDHADDDELLAAAMRENKSCRKAAEQPTPQNSTTLNDLCAGFKKMAIGSRKYLEASREEWRDLYQHAATMQDEFYDFIRNEICQEFVPYLGKRTQEVCQSTKNLAQLVAASVKELWQDDVFWQWPPAKKWDALAYDSFRKFNAVAFTCAVFAACTHGCGYKMGNFFLESTPVPKLCCVGTFTYLQQTAMHEIFIPARDSNQLCYRSAAAWVLCSAAIAFVFVDRIKTQEEVHKFMIENERYYLHPTALVPIEASLALGAHLIMALWCTVIRPPGGVREHLCKMSWPQILGGVDVTKALEVAKKDCAAATGACDKCGKTDCRQAAAARAATSSQEGVTMSKNQRMKLRKAQKQELEEQEKRQKQQEAGVDVALSTGRQEPPGPEHLAASGAVFFAVREAALAHAPTAEKKETKENQGEVTGPSAVAVPTPATLLSGRGSESAGPHRNGEITFTEESQEINKTTEPAASSYYAFEAARATATRTDTPSSTALSGTSTPSVVLPSSHPWPSKQFCSSYMNCNSRNKDDADTRSARNVIKSSRATSPQEDALDGAGGKVISTKSATSSPGQASRRDELEPEALLD
ncbi:unnamed protein product [Amoebophrya sp. A120]|nr:unnamed protein product [Amoebophrya sp. A120]|eukprot:GSA120T00012631001.1